MAPCCGLARHHPCTLPAAAGSTSCRYVRCTPGDWPCPGPAVSCACGKAAIVHLLIEEASDQKLRAPAALDRHGCRCTSLGGLPNFQVRASLIFRYQRCRRIHFSGVQVPNLVFRPVLHTRPIHTNTSHKTVVFFGYFYAPCIGKLTKKKRLPIGVCGPLCQHTSAGCITFN